MKATGLGREVGGVAANYLGPLRALPADCFSRGWIFGSARCGWERVANLWWPEQRQGIGGAQIAWAALPGDLGWDVASP